MKRIALTVFSVTALPLATIATAEEGDVERGREVFGTIAGIGCKSCHGDFAEGDLGVGPYIRGATDGSIRAAIEGIGEMVVVRNVISEQQIDSIAAYLKYLGSMQVARTLSKRGRFLPDSFSTRPGTRLQLIVKNSGIRPATYQSDNMDIEVFTIAGRSTASIEWQAPESEGSYSLYCSDCKLKDQFFAIRVDANAPEYAGAVQASAASGNNEM